MEKQFNFVIKLSLQEIALRRVVVNLWSENDLLPTIQNFQIETDWLCINNDLIANEDWRHIVEQKIKDKVSKLKLPELLKKRMIDIVRPIGLEILRWKIFHEQYEAPVLEQLCWTSAGAVDYKKTAEKIIQMEALDITKRYVLACLYCWEDHIQVIWEQLPQESKRCFSDRLDHLDYRIIPLELCWPYILKREEFKLDYMVPLEHLNVLSFHQYAFLSSACNGNRGATEYFFQKLTKQERDSSLLRAPNFLLNFQNYRLSGLSNFSNQKLSDVLCYLLTLMSTEERMEILNRHPGDILCCLLDWPWQDLFLNTADFMWTFLPDTAHSDLLRRISNKISNADYHFPKLLQEFILRSPRHLKKYFICYLYSFPEFAGIVGTETIQMIFREAEPEDRVELFSSYDFLNHLSGHIMKDEWNIVEVFLREAMLSEEGKKVIKEEFREFVEAFDLEDSLCRTNKLEQFFKLLDKTESND